MSVLLLRSGWRRNCVMVDREVQMHTTLFDTLLMQSPFSWDKISVIICSRILRIGYSGDSAYVCVCVLVLSIFCTGIRVA